MGITIKREASEEDYVAESSHQTSSNLNDEFDITGINIANKLRRMDKRQRIYAEYLIDSIIFYGLQKKLDATKIISLQQQFQLTHQNN